MQSCPHCGGLLVSEELTNEKKDACYYKVKSRYKVWPSAYASGALVQCRKRGAANWGTTTEGIEENLRKWFDDKWVRFGPDGKIRGDCARGDDSEGKPKCLPQSKAHALGKKGRASAAQRKRRQDPNPERTGAAINVATKKESVEKPTDVITIAHQEDPDYIIYHSKNRNAYAAQGVGTANGKIPRKWFKRLSGAAAHAEKHTHNNGQPVSESVYWCRLDSVYKSVPNGYIKTPMGYITRKI